LDETVSRLLAKSIISSLCGVYPGYLRYTIPSHEVVLINTGW